MCCSLSTGGCPLRAGCPLSGRSPFCLSWPVLVSVTAHPWQRQDTAKGGGWSQERHKETGQGTEPSTTMLRSACDLARYKIAEPEGEGCYSLGGPWGPNPRARPAWHHEHQPAGLRPPPPPVPHCTGPTLCPWALLTTWMTRPKEPSRGDPERHPCQHSHLRPPQPPGDCAQRAASPGLLQEGPAACAPPLWLHWPSGVPLSPLPE